MTEDSGLRVETTSRSVLGGGLWTLLAALVPQAYVLVMSLVAARVLGPDLMGEQSYISFVQITVTLLITGGYSAALMRYVAELLGRREPAEALGLIAWTRRRQAVAGLVGAAGLAAVATATTDRRVAWGLAATAALFGVLQSVPHAALLGSQRWRAVAVASMVVGAVATAATVAVLLAGAGIEGMFAVEAAASAVMFVAFTGILRRSTSARGRRPDTALLGEVRRYALGAWAHLVLHVVVWRRAELFVLERTAASAEVAHYSIAFALVTAVLRIPASLASTLTPAFAALHGEDEHDRIGTGFGRSIRLLATLSLPLTAIATALAAPAVSTLYGDEYSQAGKVATLMVLVVPVVPIHSVSSALLQGLGRIRAVLAANGVATVVNIGLALLVIPRHGALGAAVVNGTSQLVASVLTLVAARRSVPVVVGVRHLVVPATYSAVTGVVIWVLAQAVGGIPGLLAGATVGAVLLAAATLRFGLITPDDAAWLDDVLGDRLPSRLRPLLARLSIGPTVTAIGPGGPRA